jgi:hypothetical protein
MIFDEMEKMVWTDFLDFHAKPASFQWFLNPCMQHVNRPPQ